MGNSGAIVYIPNVTVSNHFNKNTVYRVGYQNSDTHKYESFTYTQSDNVANHIGTGDAVLQLPLQLKNFVKAKKFNIDPDELYNAVSDNLIMQRQHGIKDEANYTSNVDVTTRQTSILSILKDLITRFSGDNTEGGRMITPNEQYKMMTLWAKKFRDE